jgi:hypothetical protein
MKKHKKNGCWYYQWQLSVAILVLWWQPVASNIALDLLHWAMGVVSYRHTAMDIKMDSKVGAYFFLLFCLLLPRQLPGQYGESSHPTAASSGFRSIPQHVAFEDAHRIALVNPQGLQNGPRGRYISLSLLILSSTTTVAKYHEIVNIN